MGRMRIFNCIFNLKQMQDDCHKALGLPNKQKFLLRLVESTFLRLKAAHERHKLLNNIRSPGWLPVVRVHICIFCMTYCMHIAKFE